MARRLIVGFVLLLMLSSCAATSGSSAPLPTAILTVTPGVQTTTVPNLTQPAALGSKQIGDLSVWIYSNPAAPVRGANKLEAVIVDASGQPVSDAKISFDIDMTNMSHGKNVVEATALGAGRYSGNVNFMMPGPWRVIVAIGRSGQTSTVRFDFTVKSK